MIKFTGHPLVDIGLATIAAFAKRQTVEDITVDDMEKMADYIEEQYPRNPLKSFLGVAFTTNAWFNQPAFDKAPHKRKNYADRLLRGFRLNIPRLKEQCVFTGLPAVAIAFSDSLPPGRGFRQHIPLLTGEGVINFFPWGEAGLPVSGEAILAIQAFPLGCAKVGGKLLAIHSENPHILLAFAAEFLKENRKNILAAQQAGSSKMPEAKASPRTLLIEKFLEIERERRNTDDELNTASSVTAYHLSNSGQANPMDLANPPLEIFHLPLQLTRFLSTMLTPAYKAEWEAITNRAWWISQGKRKGKKTEAVEDNGEYPRRNQLYEDLFTLPRTASTFIRRYFLRIPVARGPEEDPRRTYSLKKESELVSWKLTELFLREVMEMDKARIQQIRELGDRLADYVRRENDKRFFTSFFAEQNYDYFRNTLIKANLANVKRGHAPLINLDPYIEVFEEDDENRAAWKLARDLVLIRMIEILYQQGWLGSNQEAIPEMADGSSNETGLAAEKS